MKKKNLFLFSSRMVILFIFIFVFFIVLFYKLSEKKSINSRIDFSGKNIVKLSEIFKSTNESSVFCLISPYNNKVKYNLNSGNGIKISPSVHSDEVEEINDIFYKEKIFASEHEWIFVVLEDNKLSIYRYLLNKNLPIKIIEEGVVCARFKKAFFLKKENEKGSYITLMEG